MKVSFSVSAIVAMASISQTGAFTPISQMSSVQRMTVLRAEDGEGVSSLEQAVEEAADQIPFNESAAIPSSSIQEDMPAMSTSLPFMSRPAALDGALAGDVGFDPFGFAKSKEALMNYREAEVKHARLAMLAAAGWPISELFDKKIAAALNLPAAVDAADRAPALLNGGLGKISPVYWLAVVGAAAAIDVYGISKATKGGASYIPGDLGFDPLGAYPKEKEGQEWMQLAEIKNGRLAMIAIFAFAVQEFVTKTGVVDQTPIFFKPIAGVLKEYANSGYIH